MSLLSDAYEPFYIIEKKFVSDGAGGLIPTWTQGAEFQAIANVPQGSIADIANKLTEKINCTITTSRSIELDAMDVIQRKEDGMIFRILSSGRDNKTPKGAGLDMRQSKAEVWSIPDGEIIVPIPDDDDEVIP